MIVNCYKMAAEGDSRSLSSGISIPQWMKNRITDTRLDFDESTFSPPENDDSFLYIRYPQAVTRKLKSPTPVRKVCNTDTSIGKFELDVGNHTAPCKQYLLQPGYQPNTTFTKPADLKIKSNGTDDGFKGEGAACGTSIIKVAHQMVSGKLINNTAAVGDDPLRPKGFDPSKRRGSKSLPVTPISSPQGSPKSRRRLGGNKYFTGPFVDNENHGGSWILQGLLSKRDVSQSVSLIAEESTKGELEKAISELHMNESKPERKVKKEFKAKPSEFRELNFWSPTSM